MHRLHMCVCVPETKTTYIQTQNARTPVGVYVGKEVYKHTYEVTVFLFFFILFLHSKIIALGGHKSQWDLI